MNYGLGIELGRKMDIFFGELGNSHGKRRGTLYRQFHSVLYTNPSTVAAAMNVIF